MTKYDMTAIRYLEPGFLPLARNRKSYICPNCGSGSGKNGSGMTSRDGEYWKCWSCGLSANKVELFRIQNSLNYEDACAGILKFYGIVPTPIGETTKKSAVWLSQEEADALAVTNTGMQIDTPDGEKIVSFCGLYEQDPQLYCSLIIARAEEMTRKYQKLYRACGNRLAPYAAMVYDYLGDRFDDSAYQKMRRSLENKMQICDKLRVVYLKKQEWLANQNAQAGTMRTGRSQTK